MFERLLIVKLSFSDCRRKCRCEEQSKGRLSAASSCGCITGVINETFVRGNHSRGVHHQSCNQQQLQPHQQPGKPLQQAMPLQVAPPPPYRCMVNGAGGGSGSLHSSSNSLHQPVIRSNSMHQSSSNGCNAMLHVQAGSRVSLQPSSGQVSRQASASSLNNFNAYSQQNSVHSLNAQSVQCANLVDNANACSRCVRCALPSRSALERSLQEAKARVAQLKQELECSRHSLHEPSLFCRTADSRTSSVDCVHCSGDRVDSGLLAGGPVFSSAGSLNTACSQLNGSSCTVASNGSNGGADQHTRDLRIRMLNNYMQQATECIYGKQRQPTSVNGSNHSLATNSAVPSFNSSGSRSSLVQSNLTTSSGSVYRNGNGCLSAGNLHPHSPNGSRNQLQDSCSSIASDFVPNNTRASGNSFNENAVSTSVSTTTHPIENIYSNQQMIQSASGWRFSNSQGNLSTSSSLNLNVPTSEQQLSKQSITISSLTSPTTAVAYSQRVVNTPANCQMASMSTAYPINCNGMSVPNSVHGSGNMLNALSNNGSGSSCSSNQSSVTSGCSAGSGGSASIDRHRLQQSLFEARERVAALKKDLESGVATSMQVQQLHTRLQQQQQQLHQKQILQQQHDQLEAQKQLQQQQNQQLEALLNRVSTSGSAASAARLLQPAKVNDLSNGYDLGNDDNNDSSDSYPLYQNLSHLQLRAGQKKISANSQVIYTNLSSLLSAEHSPNSVNGLAAHRALSSSERTMLELEANYDLLSLIDKYYRKNEGSTAVEV